MVDSSDRGAGLLLPLSVLLSLPLTRRVGPRFLTVGIGHVQVRLPRHVALAPRPQSTKGISTSLLRLIVFRKRGSTSLEASERRRRKKRETESIVNRGDLHQHLLLPAATSARVGKERSKGREERKRRPRSEVWGRSTFLSSPQQPRTQKNVYRPQPPSTSSGKPSRSSIEEISTNTSSSLPPLPQGSEKREVREGRNERGDRDLKSKSKERSRKKKVGDDDGLGRVRDPLGPPVQPRDPLPIMPLGGGGEVRSQPEQERQAGGPLQQALST
ncbi:hypothetical protein IE53DRAFT_167011 [Violaceomyces palustris]|uniref:Uncharacterized protein n=1 Tax=Violaceomyces palustris TaxID=1673888 RepID=A0ACD0NT82_9BASI|nr:hypothetical protein IE53DRAFT_167011 [Violaceomyces palustris]